jgi:hypothetical protein
MKGPSELQAHLQNLQFAVQEQDPVLDKFLA